MQNWLIPLHLKLSLCRSIPLGSQWTGYGDGYSVALGDLPQVTKPLNESWYLDSSFIWECCQGPERALAVRSWGYRSSNSQPNHQASCCQPVKDPAKGGRLFFWADGGHQAALWPLPITEGPNQRLCPLSCKGVAFRTIMRKRSITCSVVTYWEMSKFCNLTSTSGVLPTWITSPNCTSPFPFVA